MQITEIKVPLLVIPFKKHNIFKIKVLEKIDNYHNFDLPYKKDNDSISKTDWNDKESFKEYLSIIKTDLIESVSESFQYFNSKGIAFGNFWFQQYNKNDFHDWHIHKHCHWTSVYFLELPHTSLKTEIQSFDRQSLLEYNAKEGDIITFPSCLYHRSPINQLPIRKTIISFNSNYI